MIVRIALRYRGSDVWFEIDQKTCGYRMDTSTIPDRLVAADWSAFATNRAAWWLDSSSRTIRGLSVEGELTLSTLLSAAESLPEHQIHADQHARLTALEQRFGRG